MLNPGTVDIRNSHSDVVTSADGSGTGAGPLQHALGLLALLLASQPPLGSRRRLDGDSARALVPVWHLQTALHAGDG